MWSSWTEEAGTFGATVRTLLCFVTGGGRGKVIAVRFSLSLSQLQSCGIGTIHELITWRCVLSCIQNLYSGQESSLFFLKVIFIYC